MLHIGEKTSIKEEFSEYTKVNKDEIVEHGIHIEKIIIGETEENENFAAVAGIDVTNKNIKVWFYAPTYDYSCLCQATPEEIEDVCNNGYLYIVKQTVGKNKRLYYTGYIIEEQ